MIWQGGQTYLPTAPNKGPAMPPAPSPAQILTAARGMIAGGRRGKAAALLRKHLYRNSRDRAARKLLASLGPDAHPHPALSAQERAARQALLTAFRAGDHRTVLARAEPLLKRQPLLSDIANALGNALTATGQHAQAARVLDHAIRTDPASPDAYLSLSSLLRTRGQPAEALAAAEAALDVAPESAACHVALGLAHLDLDATETAETNLRRATELDPRAPQAWDALAKMLERQNRLDDLDAVLSQAEAHLPDDPQILLNRAVHLGRVNRHEGVLDTAARIPDLPPREAAILHVTRARALDALDDPDAAMDAFTAMNDAAGSFPGRGDISGARYLARVEHHLAAAARIAPATRTGTTRQPVFMVGFPRSGTTLLETILLTHPRVALVEEQPLINLLTDGLRPETLAQDLAALSHAEADSRARAYLAAFETALGAPLDTRTGFDKLPLNLVEAAAIARCFPQAKFIFSLRHPCDVVLSCFMQNFAPNDAMENFRNLEDAAILYDRVMTLWTASTEALRLDTVTLRYEDLTQDLRGAITPVLAHLGLDWIDAMDRFHETTRPMVRTASYRQVSQPLYQCATGRWRRYEAHLAPMMDRLAPWIDGFGY